MTIETEIKEMKNMLGELGVKLGTLIQNRETLTMMIVLERPLKDFPATEPDPHFPRDVKMRSHPELEP